MWDVDYEGMYDDVWKLRNDADKLADLLRDDYESDINDWCRMAKIGEILSGLMDSIISCQDWDLFLYKMESDKDKFEVQKMIKYQMEKLYRHVERPINIARIWKMKDYRCINFQNRMEALFVRIQEEIQEAIKK